MKEVDPIEELHKIREAIWKEAGGTPAAYARYYMERQKQNADRLVDLSKSKSAPKESRRKPAKKAAPAASVRKAGQRRKAVAP